MTSIWTITRKEIWEKATSLEFLLSFFLIGALLLGAIYTKSQNYKEQLINYYSNTNAQAIELRQSQSYFELANRPINFFRRPTVSQIMATGINRDLSSLYYIMFFIREKVNGKSDFLGDSLTTYFTVIDFVFVISILFSLFTFLQTVNSINKEQEMGTLKLVSANPISRSEIILGKVLGNLIMFSTALVAFFALAAVTFLYDKQIQFTSQDFALLILMFVGTLFFASSCLFLGVLVSILIRRTATALLTVVLMWASFFVFLPSILSNIAGESRSVASHTVKEQVGKQEDVLSKEWLRKINPAAESFKITRDRAQYVSSVIQGDSQYIEGNRRIAQEYYISRLLSQDRIFKRFALVSPAAIFSYFAYTLADTTAESEMNYYQGLIDFVQYDYAPYLFRKQVEEATARRNVGKRIDLGDMPQFGPTPTDFYVRIRKALPFIGALLSYNIIFFLLSYFFFIKMRIS